LLSGRRWLGIPHLRAIELGLFGMTAAFDALRQYMALNEAVQDADPAKAVIAITFSALVWYALIAVYAMFIPNTWRRAALVIGFLTAIPACLDLAMIARHELVSQALTHGPLSGLVLIILAGVLTSIYGTHLISTLRVQTFESETHGRALFNASPQ